LNHRKKMKAEPSWALLRTFTASLEVLIVESNKMHCITPVPWPRVALVGLSPQTKLQAPEIEI